VSAGELRDEPSPREVRSPSKCALGSCSLRGLWRARDGTALSPQTRAIAVIATNTDAIPFYERRGAVPFVTQFVKRV